MENLTTSQITDLRQSVPYAKYIRSIGWKVIEITDPRSKMLDKTRPAMRGSEMTLRTGMRSHIYKGCLPSERGKNLKVDSADMT